MAKLLKVSWKRQVPDRERIKTRKLFAPSINVIVTFMCAGNISNKTRSKHVWFTCGKMWKES